MKVRCLAPSVSYRVATPKLFDLVGKPLDQVHAPCSLTSALFQCLRAESGGLHRTWLLFTPHSRVNDRSATHVRNAEKRIVGTRPNGEFVSLGGYFVNAIDPMRRVNIARST
jgi:hypothetical protein